MSLPTLSKADLIALSETDVTKPIPRESIFAALATPPFLYIPGTFNTRDLGLLSLSSSSNGNKIRPGLIYRSGGFFPNGGFDDAAKTQLSTQLGIKKIFDIRSVREHTHAPDPEINGVENVWVGSAEKEATVDLKDFLEGKGEGGRGRGAGSAAVPLHGWTRQNGVVAGLLLSLAGVSEEDVEMDWMLSRIGTEMAREQLLGFAMKGAGCKSVEEPGFANLVSLRRECWGAFVEEVKRVYGGWRGYVRGTLGLTEEEVERVGRVLRGE
ncbi:protein-tyrosine phosphatase-like protein [Sordaria brevicollis]|uniref:Protein-tyrosine phosphatase-like protein n=1 Tax=Sordaria brevicollis TaxID=83679 RepID=A0AAE0PPF9_SORBR|nr:protein-tyrosine phosphatase-like protein [Sordaria brevicollis]